MRERRYGLVEILDEKIEKTFIRDTCQPAITQVTVAKVSSNQKMKIGFQSDSEFLFK